MNITDIKNILKEHRGQNLRAIWGKALKTRKGVTDLVEKVTSIVIRGAIDYDNLAVVQEKRESGELPAENAGLPWGEWAEFPLHITHKGTDYARFYNGSGINVANGQEFRPMVEYYLNGELSDKATVEPLCLASEFRSSEDKPDCYTVKAENVRAILV